MLQISLKFIREFTFKITAVVAITKSHINNLSMTDVWYALHCSTDVPNVERKWKSSFNLNMFLRSLFFHPILMRYVYFNHLQGTISILFLFTLFLPTSPRVPAREKLWGRILKFKKKILLNFLKLSSSNKAEFSLIRTQLKLSS